MQFYFIRHGQSENNLMWAQTGSWNERNEDPELTPAGWQQAEVLAAALAATPPGVDYGEALPGLNYNPHNVGGFGLTHLYCSLMVRAVQTGQAVARALDLPLVAWPEIHEAGGIHVSDPETGERAGRPGHGRSFFETHYPQLVLPDSVGEAGWWNRPFEEYEERPERAQRFLEELARRHGGSDDRVAVISHGGFYNHVMRRLLDMPEERDRRWFSMNNAAITRIDFDEETTWLHYTNRCDYLPPGLIT